MSDFYDAARELELDESGDIKRATGVDMVMQRAIDILLSPPGDMLWRPEVGGGLAALARKPPTPQNIQAAVNRAARTLSALDYIDDHRVAMRPGDDGAWYMDLVISVGGQSLTARDIRLED